MHFEIKGREAFKETFKDWLYEMGDRMYVGSSFMRNEINTTNGITVANSSSVKFYLPLDPIISFANTVIFGNKASNKSWKWGDIVSLKLDITPTSAVSNVSQASKICSASADVNMWDTSKVRFTNIGYQRQYFINSSADQIVPIFNTSRPQSFFVYETKDERVYPGAWNLSSNSTVSFATIDIGKFADIAYYSVYARKVPTAYNDADCEKEYSGHRRLVYKYREAYGEQREVDLTDERILRDHEMMQYQKLYGNSKQLPLELWTTDSDFDKYHLRRTCLTFDEFADGPFEVKRRMNTLANASNDNYVVDVYANSNLGSAVEIHVVQVRMIEYRYNKETGGFVKVN